MGLQCYLLSKCVFCELDLSPCLVATDPTRSWDNPYSGQVRLVGGSTVNQGLVEVYCNGQWGTVCAGPTLGSLTQSRGVANSVCRQLGYTNSYRVLHLPE